MEKLYFYLEDCNGGFIVDADYMEDSFDSEYETIICTGTLKEIEEYIGFLCNN